MLCIGHPFLHFKMERQLGHSPVRYFSVENKFRIVSCNCLVDLSYFRGVKCRVGCFSPRIYESQPE